MTATAFVPTLATRAADAAPIAAAPPARTSISVMAVFMRIEAAVALAFTVALSGAAVTAGDGVRMVAGATFLFAIAAWLTARAASRGRQSAYGWSAALQVVAMVGISAAGLGTAWPLPVAVAVALPAAGLLVLSVPSVRDELGAD